MSDLQGEIIFGGQGVFSLSLSNGEVREVTRINSISVQTVSMISPDRVLLSYFDLKPTETRNKVAIYNLATRELQALWDGRNAIYFSSIEKVVFIGPNEFLSIADLEDTTVAEIASGRVDGAIVKMSEAEFLYESDRTLFKYDLRTGANEVITKMTNCSLFGAVWIEDRSEVLCSGKNSDGVYSGAYSFMSLDGELRGSITITGRPVGYMSAQRAIVLVEEVSEGSGRVRFPVFLHSLDSDSKIQVSNNARIGPGSHIINSTAIR